MSFHKWVSIREYRKSDLNDLISTGYPFNDALELASIYRTLKSKILDVLQKSETRRLVLYDRKSKKAIGTVKLRKVNDNLWGIWRIYVAPSYRGHNLSVLLYRAAFSYLKERGVKKAFGSVDINNIPSIKTIEKIWDGYLPQKYYKFHGLMLHVLKSLKSKITIRSASHKEKNSLFQIYVQCVSEKWVDFLEIDESNFLGFQRIFPGVPFLEGMLKFITPVRTLVAENPNGQIMGYAVTIRNLIVPISKNTVSLYLFLSPTLSSDDAIEIVGRIAKSLQHEGFTRFEIFSVNKNEKLLDEISLKLKNYDLGTIKSLVCIKTLT
ncbi:MAG: GNAT family N-acetyltransferase [Candidatus Bathyarchaeota archaeon]|jgi:RimJ/RimL family protein N-acetyltransferase|nr:GNAT family N-acetyltransferase [Candidatus Bathyarchaeota archaeon]